MKTYTGLLIVSLLWLLLAAHPNPATSPIPPPLGVINCRRLYEPFFPIFSRPGRRARVGGMKKKNARVKREFLQLAPFQAMPCPRPARRHRNRPWVLDVCPLALAGSRCCGTVIGGRGVRAKKARNERRKERRYWPIVSMFIQFSNILTNPRPLQAGAVARDKLAPAFYSQTGTGASSHTDPPTTASAFSWEPDDGDHATWRGRLAQRDDVSRPVLGRAHDHIATGGRSGSADGGGKGWRGRESSRLV